MAEKRKGSIDLGTASFLIALMPFAGRMIILNAARDNPDLGKIPHWYMDPIASLLAVTAIVTGTIVVIRAITRNEKKGLGLAIAGISIGSFQLAIFALAALFSMLRNTIH